MPRGVTKRLLVIDNDPVCTRMVRLILEKNGGFEVQELNDPTHALTAAGVFRPDLILLDVQMPGLDGGDVARRLRTVPGLRELPIVFMTGLLTEDDEAAGAHFSDGSRVLAKPVTMAKLIDCVAGMLNALCSSSTAL